MKINMRISEQVYTWTEIWNTDELKPPYDRRFKPKERRIKEACLQYRAKHITRFSCSKVQKMWKIKLSLYHRTKTRELLSRCQYAWRLKTHYDLRLPQIHRQGQEVLRKLSKNEKNSRRTQRYQS